ncbi:MAG TPA: hypothetical protein H9805_00385 [Candidatus Janibacter merdipullorum]|nr:hypothetical protein [Candidatus Janibacter merdipullorum]
MDADPIYLPPQDYSVIWPVLGGFILFALLIWALSIWMMTRPPEGEDGSAPLPPQALAKLRRDALARVDAIEAEVTSGSMPARRGHHELSKVVRGFVSRASGLEADTMTAADLRQRGPAHLAAVIEEYYPRQFGIEEAGRPTIGRSATAAREVVGGWS